MNVKNPCSKRVYVVKPGRKAVRLHPMEIDLAAILRRMGR